MADYWSRVRNVPEEHETRRKKSENQSQSKRNQEEAEEAPIGQRIRQREL